MKVNKIFYIFLALIFASSVAFASVGVKEEGTMLGAATDINFVGNAITASGAYGGKTVTLTASVVDLHNTTDMTAITAAESGTTYICTQNTKFQLPAAAANLSYTFVAGAAIEIEIQIATTPTTIVLTDTGSGVFDNAVVETSETNTTGNTVTLVSDGTNWYAINKDGNWADGGTWEFLNYGAQ